jgi:hypothetical protein
MKRTVTIALVGAVSAMLVAAPAGAAELTVRSILGAQQAGAPSAGIIAMVNNPANTIVMTVADIATLRRAGVSEKVITAIWAQVPPPVQAPEPIQPDDARLVDVVRLTKSGMNDANTAEQVRQSRTAYALSINDLLYLKQNDVGESTIAALMATAAGPSGAPGVAPAEMVFKDLVLVNRGFWKKDAEGRLVMRGDTLSWENPRHPDKDFTFQTTGLDKVWFTCEARSSGDYCHQINFKIVKGDSYRFQDSGRDSGSNAAVLSVMDALRRYHPRLNYATPNVDD